MPKYVDDMLFLWIILNVPLVVGYLVSLSKLRDEVCLPKSKSSSKVLGNEALDRGDLET